MAALKIPKTREMTIPMSQRRESRAAVPTEGSSPLLIAVLVTRRCIRARLARLECNTAQRSFRRESSLLLRVIRGFFGLVRALVGSFRAVLGLVRGALGT